jgi:hypothetical protein
VFDRIERFHQDRQKDHISKENSSIFYHMEWPSLDFQKDHQSNFQRCSQKVNQGDPKSSEADNGNLPNCLFPIKLAVKRPLFKFQKVRGP